MKIENSKQVFVHVRTTITVNEDSWPYSEPNCGKSIEFDMPVEMFSSGNLSSFIQAKVNGAVKEFSQVKADYEAEKAKKEAEEKESA